MSDVWAVRFVDKQVDQAWLELRIELADRLAAGLEAGTMEPIEIGTATGESVGVGVAESRVVVTAGDGVRTIESVDEAAYVVVQLLREEWQVVHPVFLDAGFSEAPVVVEEVPAPAAGASGRAESTGQLREWVLASFESRSRKPLSTTDDGDVVWRGSRDEPVVVTVRDRSCIEIWTVLGREVSFKKARKVIDELNVRYGPLKFHLRQDVLVMSHALVATPYVEKHLLAACRGFIKVSDELGWVEDKALRKRAHAERAELAEAEEELASLRQQLEETKDELRVAHRTAARRKAERTWLAQRLDHVQAERDAAQAGVAALKAQLHGLTEESA